MTWTIHSAEKDRKTIDVARVGCTVQHNRILRMISSIIQISLFFLFSLFSFGIAMLPIVLQYVPEISRFAY